jgi:Phage tail repeat like
MATLTKGKTFTNGELVTPATIHQLVDAATISGIVNADIAAGAAIVDTKLAQITTASKVAQSAVANLTNDLAGKAAASHTHTIANVTGLQTALDGKQASGSYAPATGIAQSAVTNLTTDLAGKAASSHTHDDRYYTESEMNTLLAGKQASGSYVTNGGNVSSIQRVTAMPATPAANTLYIVIP